MKRIFMLVCLWIAVCSAVIYAQTLDEAILTAAITMGRELPAGVSVAVIDFISDSENLSEYVLNEFYGAILRNRSVIPVQPNQGQFKSIRDEYNKAGELNGESAKGIGKLLGVQYLITGSIKQNGSLYSIIFIAVNLDAEIKSQYQASINPRSDMRLASLLNVKPQSQSQPKPQPTASSTSRQKPVTIDVIAGVNVPATGETPVKTITENAQYSGTVTWSPSVSRTFEPNTQYTAVITLTAKKGYTLQGVEANSFNVAGASSVSNNTDTGIITAVFPSTLAVINVINADITGVTVPVLGKIPVMAIETAQYRGTVTWSPEVSETFAEATQYTATITLTAKDGYTFEGVWADFFKVAGAKATNDENSGIVTAAFPSTKGAKAPKYPEDAKLQTVGVSWGTFDFYDTIFCTVHGTFAPFKYSFFEFGMDVSWMGYLHPSSWNTERFVLYPFANYALFLPFGRTKKGIRMGGWYAGVGFGLEFANYTFERGLFLGNTTFTIWDTIAVMNIFTGFNLGIFDISVIWQSNIYWLYPKWSMGYVYRFK